MKAISYAAVAALLALGAPASAKVLQFKIKNVSAPDKGSFIFRLDDSVAPSIRVAETIRYNNVSVRYGLVPGLGTGTLTTGVSFANQVRGGGVALGALPNGLGTLQFRGVSLLTNANFSGSAPLIFKTGTFDEKLTPGATVNNYTVTISAVPEPAAWAMMIGGFAVVGASMRRRSVKALAA